MANRLPVNAEGEGQRVTAQQAVIARLGLEALSGLPLDELMDRAVQQVAVTLDVEYVKILKWLPQEDALLLVAGVGWQEGLVGRATIGAGADIQAGYTLERDEPVIVEALDTDERFSGPALLTEHDVVSGISVVIQGQERPFGVFGAHTRHRRAFDAHAVDFLQAVANVVGAAIERRRTEEALRRSEQRLAVAVEASGGGVYEHSVPMGDDLYHSARWARILGYDPHELPTGPAFLRWLLERVHPDDAEAQRQAYDDFVSRRTNTYDMEVRLRHKDGHWLWVRSFSRALERDERGRVQRLAGLMFDIEERKRAQAERERLLKMLNIERARLQALAISLEERVVQRTQQLQQRTEQLRASASSLTVAEQRERERISRILHDDLQQLLYAAQMQATIMESDLVEQGADEALLASLGELERLHSRAVAVTRLLTVELSPPVLEGEGLAQALHWLQSHMESTYGLEIVLTAERGIDVEGDDVRELVFQMVRELLFNVVKHAGVARAHVTLRADGDRCLIEVADEGGGFDADNMESAGPRNMGLGLRTMRERLSFFDGTLALETAPGEGTRVTIGVPCRRKKRASNG